MELPRACDDVPGARTGGRATSALSPDGRPAGGPRRGGATVLEIARRSHYGLSTILRYRTVPLSDAGDCAGVSADRVVSSASLTSCW